MASGTVQELASDLKQAAEILSLGVIDSARRREVLRACEAVRTALLGMGFDEESSRRRVVSFLRSVWLANGVIGKRTAFRLCHRTFEEDGEAALKWLVDRSLLEDQGSEGFAITEEGQRYLEANQGEAAAAPSERRDQDQRRRRPQGTRGRSEPSVQTPAVVPPAPEVIEGI